MFERFSTGYFLGRLFVEPYDGEQAVIQRDDHERMNERLYTDGTGVEPLDAPLVMKLDGSHFPVHGEDGVPTGTLAIPRQMASRDLPNEREILLASPERASELLRYAGYEFPRGT
jgi:hypothetical protein